jgi:hypothetical protein
MSCGYQEVNINISAALAMGMPASILTVPNPQLHEDVVNSSPNEATITDLLTNLTVCVSHRTSVIDTEEEHR